jgi:hypothetical protein
MLTSLREPPSATSLLALLTGLVLSSCLHDPGQRCGPAMTYVAAAAACVCDSDAIERVYVEFQPGQGTALRFRLPEADGQILPLRPPIQPISLIATDR